MKFMTEIYPTASKPKVEEVYESNFDGLLTKLYVYTDKFGVKTWKLNLSIHRCIGPAVVYPNGDEYWYELGSLHREGGPAIRVGTSEYYYKHGRLHNANGPAIIENGTKYYYQDGFLHREDGPAIEFPNGNGHWYIGGVFQKEVGNMVEIINNAKPKTQKAKSIIYGCTELQEDASYCFSLRGYGTKSLKTIKPILIQNVYDIKKLNDHLFDNMIFARPCPKTPRHGFVDSRIVSNKTELKALLKEVLEADPSGEIVLTKFLDSAVCSAVLTTNGTISIGPGHNGATAGKSSFSLPVKPEDLPVNVKRKAGVAKYDNAFIETVFAPYEDWTESFYYTQVRGGPAIDAVKDFIPKKAIVKKVIAPNDDLVAWEKEVKKLAAGTVVYGPGHTLASHAAIHCVVNNIPFITSFKPNVGQSIKPATNVKLKFDSRQFNVGFTIGIDSKIEMSTMLHISASVLHNWAYLRGADQSSFMLGLSVGYFIKVLCALNFGEYRYSNDDIKNELSREDIYKNLMKTKKFSFYISKCPKIAHDFKNKKLFNTGFGGTKWSKAAAMCVEIWNAVAEITNKGLDEKSANNLVKMLNKAINLVHNNGWLFNKISDQVLLNFVAEHPSLALLQLSDYFYKALVASKKIKRLRKFNKVVYVK